MYIVKVSCAFVLISFSHGESDAFQDVNYDEFIGSWHSCLETGHMTFGGESQKKKHTVQNRKCLGVQMANITYVGDENGMDNTGFEEVTQILQLERWGLNHCEMWGLTGDTCPNSTIPDGGRLMEQTVLYKQNFHGIGSYLTRNHLKFYGEEKTITTVDGKTIRGMYDAIEDQDFFDCTYDAALKGLLCDRRQNEWRNGMGDGSEWIPMAYSDFGTHYLVKDMADCKFCPDYECTETKGSFDITDIFGLATLKKASCNNIGKIENEHVKKAVCDSKGLIKKKGKVPEKKALVKELCPNVCGECMD